MKIFALIQTKNGHEVKQLNRRKAIRERCLNCSAWAAAEVRKCEHTDCALYPFRMPNGKQDPKERNRAIRAYCLWCCCDQPSEVKQCPSMDCPLYYFRTHSAIKEYQAPTDNPLPQESSRKVEIRGQTGRHPEPDHCSFYGNYRQPIEPLIEAPNIE